MLRFITKVKYCCSRLDGSIESHTFLLWFDGLIPQVKVRNYDGSKYIPLDYCPFCGARL